MLLEAIHGDTRLRVPDHHVGVFPSLCCCQQPTIRLQRNSGRGVGMVCRPRIGQRPVTRLAVRIIYDILHTGVCEAMHGALQWAHRGCQRCHDVVVAIEQSLGPRIAGTGAHDGRTNGIIVHIWTIGIRNQPCRQVGAVVWEGMEGQMSGGQCVAPIRERHGHAGGLIPTSLHGHRDDTYLKPFKCWSCMLFGCFYACTRACVRVNLRKITIDCCTSPACSRRVLCTYLTPEVPSQVGIQRQSGSRCSGSCPPVTALTHNMCNASRICDTCCNFSR